MEPGALLAGREVDVGTRPQTRPVVLGTVEAGRPEPVLPGELDRVLDAHPALFGRVDEEQAPEGPERLPAEVGPRLLLDDHDLSARSGQLGRGDESRETRPHDDRVRVGHWPILSAGSAVSPRATAPVRQPISDLLAVAAPTHLSCSRPGSPTRPRYEVGHMIVSCLALLAQTVWPGVIARVSPLSAAAGTGRRATRSPVGCRRLPPRGRPPGRAARRDGSSRRSSWAARRTDPADPLPRREVLTRIPEDRQGRLLGGFVAGREDDVGLGDRQPHRIGSGHDGGLGDRRVLDEDRLQLERADLVVAGLEDVVGAADVGDVALAVDGRDVTGVVVPARLPRRCARRRPGSRSSAAAGGR